MNRYAAVASDGSRFREKDRDRIDAWASNKCAQGLSVNVYGLRVIPGPVKDVGVERVGLWIPAGAE